MAVNQSEREIIKGKFLNTFPIHSHPMDMEVGPTGDNIRTLWKRYKALSLLISEFVDSVYNYTDNSVTNISGGGGLAVAEVNALIQSYFRSKLKDFDQSATTNSDGQVTQILYKRAGATKITEVITYNAYGNISTQTFSGEITGTWTYSYDTDNQTLTGVVKS